MVRGEPDSWARWLPGYGGTRIVIDGALTPGFDEASSLAAGLGWIAALVIVTGLVLVPRCGQGRAQRHCRSPRPVTNNLTGRTFAPGGE